MSKSLSIAVSAGLQEINLSPGERYEGEFFVLNPSIEDSTVEFSATVAPASFENDTYEVYFDYPMDYNQITDWVTIENTEGEVSGGDRVPVKYTINVPEDAPAGGQYCAILIRIKTPESDEQIGVSVRNNSQVAVMLYAAIDGETRKEVIVEENTISPIYLNTPITTSAVLNNTGNIHAEANLILKIYPLFSDEEIYSNEENPDKSITIPGTTYYSTRTWDNTPRLGIYKVIQEINSVGKTDIKESYTLVCPTWFLILSTAFIAACILYIIEKCIKRRNKKVLKKA